MISQCLVNNPQERPAAKDLCDHALFHVPDFNPKGVLLSLLLTSPPGEIKTPWKLASRLQQKRSYFDGHIPQLCLESSTDDGSSEEDVEAEAATHSQQCREPCAAEEPAAVAGLLEVETEVLLEQHVAPMVCGKGTSEVEIEQEHPVPENSLQKCFPHLAAQWCHVSNTTKLRITVGNAKADIIPNPSIITVSSHYLAWWVCPLHQELYQMMVRDRVLAEVGPARKGERRRYTKCTKCAKLRKEAQRK
eukprot:Colp12_sorted_trinity150504_noHs@7977